MLTSPARGSFTSIGTRRRASPSPAVSMNTAAPITVPSATRGRPARFVATPVTTLSGSNPETTAPT